jgi:predicted membrane protein
MKNILSYALVGLVVGILLAEYFPSLGKGSFESGLNDLGYALGKQKPFAAYGAIGTLVGAIIGALSGKK